MKVSEIGEFGLIERLAFTLGAPEPALLLGVGDDAAAWQQGEQTLLATTDTLVEGVHFIRDIWPWRDLGWKALAINVSDIAAMGGTPLFALVTLALPAEMDVASVEEIYEGLKECALEFGVSIAGGDVVRCPQVCLTVALIGLAARREDGEPLLLKRAGAQSGDVIAVSGTLGDAAAGIWKLRKASDPEDPLARSQLRPYPPLSLAQRAAQRGIRCGIDISDGLLQDLGHICRMSGVAAEIDAHMLPISPELRAAYPEDATALACSGGEDYQMLLTGPRDIIEALSLDTEVPLTIIGRINEGDERRFRLLNENGDEVRLETAGWDHLKER